MNVADIMSSPVYVINTDEPVSHARKLMLKHRISTLLVLNEDKMAGIITKSDIINRLAQAEPIWRRRPIDQIPIKLLMEIIASLLSRYGKYVMLLLSKIVPSRDYKSRKVKQMLLVKPCRIRYDLL